VKIKRPSFQFYPGDWLRSTDLRSCSIGARGMWIDMICLMHEGNPYGYLKVNHKVIQPVNLSRMLGLTLLEAEGYLKELEDTGVCSKDEQGCYYSRRMIKDEQTRNKRATAGARGGNPVLIKRKNLVNHLVNHEVNPDPTPASASASATALKKQDKKQTCLHFEKFWNAYPRKENKKKAIEAWKRNNLDQRFEMVIADVLKRKVQHKPWTLGYTPHAVTYINQERWNDEIDNSSRNERTQGNRPLSNTGAFYKECRDTLREIYDAESEDGKIIHDPRKSF
jgi:hypothetical protein